MKNSLYLTFFKRFMVLTAALGLFALCETVRAEEIAFGNSEYTVTIGKDSQYINIANGYAESWLSSNTEVVEITDDSYSSRLYLVMVSKVVVQEMSEPETPHLCLQFSKQENVRTLIDIALP